MCQQYGIVTVIRKKKAAGIVFQRLTFAESRNRTDDPTLFRRMLYQLSYLGSGDRPRFNAWATLPVPPRRLLRNCATNDVCSRTKSGAVKSEITGAGARLRAALKPDRVV